VTGISLPWVSNVCEKLPVRSRAEGIV
jgi:hypothetical protein